MSKAFASRDGVKGGLEALAEVGDTGDLGSLGYDSPGSCILTLFSRLAGRVDMEDVDEEDMSSPDYNPMHSLLMYYNPNSTSYLLYASFVNPFAIKCNNNWLIISYYNVITAL